MKSIVIDTNVLHVANGTTPQAGPNCILAVVERLERVRRRERVCLDETGHILDEYLRQRFSFSGQPGVGDAFFKWLFENQANPRHCERVAVKSLSEEGTRFAEFPSDPRLAGFDPSDRKFVAVALASSKKPPILNAVDSDWWEHREALLSHGVEVEFLCPDQFQEDS